MNSQTYSVEELHVALAQTPKPLVIDVRDAEELTEGFIPGSIHIPYLEMEHYAPMLLPDKQAQIVTYCATGRRSGMAAETLRQLGYVNAKNLLGGFAAWSG